MKHRSGIEQHQQWCVHYKVDPAKWRDGTDACKAGGKVLPVPTPQAVIDHNEESAEALLDFIDEVNATPPTPKEEAALRRIDERVSEGLGFPVGYLREKQNKAISKL